MVATNVKNCLIIQQEAEIIHFLLCFTCKILLMNPPPGMTGHPGDSALMMMIVEARHTSEHARVLTLECVMVCLKSSP